MQLSLKYNLLNFSTIWIASIFILCNCSKINAQQYKLLNTFTTNQGLPSNHIYDITQDNLGFLWIATDNGISRFDGKYFKNFGVSDGLPSSDVIQVKRTKDGTIWVNCYRQAPAYFDEVSNTFVSFENNSKVKEKLVAVLFIENWDSDTIAYQNKTGKLYFSKKKLVHSYSANNNIIQLTDKPNFISYTYQFVENKLRQTFYEKTIEKSKIVYNKPSTQSIYYKNKIFITCKNEEKIYILSNFIPQASLLKIDTYQLKGELANINFSNNEIHFIYKNKQIENLDIETLTIKTSLKNVANANCCFKDKNKNVWVGTFENGLHYYAIGEITTLPIDKKNMNKNFSSISYHPQNGILAGNHFGDIYSFKKNEIRQYKIAKDYSPNTIKKIVISKNNIASITDLAVNRNLKNNIPIYNKLGNKSGLKTIKFINDTNLLIGAINGLYLLQICNNTYKQLPTPEDRIFDIAKINENEFYYLNSNGLYLHRIKQEYSTEIPLPINIKKESLNLLLYAPDHTLWIATSKGNLIIVKNNLQINKINKDKYLPENITNMIAVDSNIWLASKSGISILNYKTTRNNFSYTIQNISKTDGLPGVNVNDFCMFGDSIYIATENGIAILPKNIKIICNEIIPRLISCTINQNQFPIQKNYENKANENNLLLTFAGVDLSGHFKNFEYAIDDTSAWALMNNNTINIQLTSGLHPIFIRCVDVNNTISKNVLLLNFRIATPFFKTLWFGILLSVIATAISLLVYNRRKLSLQKIHFEKQLALEQQRNKITADLHDDIGATLSSLQVNSAVAHQLVTKNPKEAEKVLEKIETQSKELAEKIGDIIWSMKPGKDEFMNISSRIKNFANDILGATSINYQIQIYQEINEMILDISIRKNIVFITKEAINNAVKYSGANQVDISIVKTYNGLQLKIVDNGNGFDVQFTEGNGIGNMKQRANEINGIFLIQSNESGTQICIDIPIKMK